MSQNSCCVPGCAVVRKDGVHLHVFPDPETSEEKFKTWILNIGGEIAKLDHQAIYDNRRVCHRHFEDICKYPTGRLSKLAIPTIHIPDPQAQSLGEAMIMSESDTSQRSQLQKCGFNTSGIELIEATSTFALASTSNIETAISKSALASPNIEAIISRPPLASTSNGTQSNNLISGTATGHFIQPGQSQCRERIINEATKLKNKLAFKVRSHTRDSWARSFNARKNAKKAGSFGSPYKEMFLKKVKFGRIIEGSDETEGDEVEEKEQEISAESDSDSTAVCENEWNVDSKEDIDLTAMNHEDNTTTNEIDDTESRHDSKISEDMLNAKMQVYLNKQMRKPSDTHDDRHFAFFKSIHPTLTLLDDDQILEFQSGVINLLRNIKSGGRFNNVANNQPSSSRGYYSQPEAPGV